MPIHTLREKFCYHLRELYAVEIQALELLDTMIEDVREDDVRSLLEDVRVETMEHRDRIVWSLDSLDARPNRRRSHVVDALVTERDVFLERTGGDADMLDLHDLEIARWLTAFEVAAYETALAEGRGLELPPGVTDRLEETLAEERQTLESLRSLEEAPTVRSVMARLG